MAVHHSDAPQELERVARRIKTLETASPQNHSSFQMNPVVIGEGATAAGIWTVSIGIETVASGNGDIAIGSKSEATGGAAIAIGDGWPQATDAGTIAIGFAAEAEGLRAIAHGDSADAKADHAIALGPVSSANYENSVAIGWNAEAEDDNEFVLGTSAHSVIVPGSFSNPSARRLKQNIIPAPYLSDLFPELVEYEYITAEGKRRVGYIADDLIGTDAERFVTYSRDGEVQGINVLELLMAQVARLHARVTELENGG